MKQINNYYDAYSDALIYDSTNCTMYKKTTWKKMKPILKSSGKSVDVRFDGTLYNLGSLNTAFHTLGGRCREELLIIGELVRKEKLTKLDIF